MNPRIVLACLCAVILPMPSAASNETLAEQVGEVMAEWDRMGSPGCAIGVVQDGEMVFRRGYGEANLDHAIPITSRTVFDIGSVSKQFTAAAVALLAERGELSLDDDVREHIPEMPGYGNVITVRHLVHHTSGIRDYLTVMSLAGLEDHDVYTLDEVVEMIARQKKLNFEPGSEYLYSNSGYMLLAEIVERVSGETFADFVEDNFFGPLGMADSRVYVDSTAVIPRRATGYAKQDERIVVDHYYNFAVPGDGQVYTTVEDLAKWDRLFYEGGIGNEDFVQRLYTRGVLNDGEEIRYAFGLGHSTHRGLETIQHGGAWGGFRASLVRFPSERTSVFTLCNFGEIGATGIALQVADVFLADRYSETDAADQAAEDTAAALAIELTAEQIENVSGLYFDSGSRSLRRIFADEGKLIYSRGGDNKTELEALQPRRFHMVGVGARVVVSFEPAQGPARTMSVMVEDDDAIRHDVVAAAEYSVEEWAAFAGEYRSDELDVTYRLAVEDGSLRLYTPADDDRLEPGFVDYFTGEENSFVSLEFERDGTGAVTGFIVNAGRVRGVGFERVLVPTE